MNKLRAQTIVSDWMVTFLYAFCLLWGAFASMQYDFSVGVMALCVALLSLLWVSILRIPTLALVFAIVFFVGTVLFLFPLLQDSTRWRALFLDWSGYFNWVWSASQSIVVPPAGYLMRSLLLMCLGASLTIGLIVRLRIHPALMLLLGGSLFFAQEFYLRELFVPALFVFLCVSALYIVRHVYYARMKRVDNAGSPLLFLASAGPLCLLAVILAMVMPHQPENLGQPIINWAAEMGLFWPVGDDTDSDIVSFGNFTYAGLKRLNGNEELGGPLRQNRSLVLYIKSERPSYLKGHTYDTYTGRSWRLEHELAEQFQHFEGVDWTAGARFGDDNSIESFVLPESANSFSFAANYELLTGVLMQADYQGKNNNGALREPINSLVTWTETTDYRADIMSSFGFLPNAIKRRKHEIVFWNMRTKSLFVPHYTIDMRISPPNERTLYRTSYSQVGDMSLPSQQGKEFRYEVEEYDLGLTRAEMATLLREGERDLPAILANTDANMEDLLRFFENSRDHAYEDNLGLPDQLPDRVRTLAEDLTRDFPLRYDKALAIESFLRQGFPYDTDVSATPEGRDFVDYFLFDLKRGYCTYYASAMTVMCRSLDIPARYVEGFVPSADTIQGLYYATGEQAHAWCEVYFDSFGWIPFDPTASFESTFARSNYNRAPTPAEALEDEPKPSRPPSTPAVSPTPPAGAADPETSPTPAQENAGWFLPVLLCLLVIVGVPFVHIWRRRVRPGAPRKEAVVFHFRRIQKMAGFLGAPARREETPMEWARHADDKLGGAGRVTFRQFAREYDRLCYGPDAPTLDEVHAFYNLSEVIVGEWKGHMSAPKYIFYRFIIGTF